jgi:GNAT superfamily N-acetyltransferase
VAEIRLLKHREKREELLDLFLASFGHNMSAELWDWKYLQNPLASADPEVIVAIDNGKIVGARPFLLAEMWLKDEKVKVAQPCDTMVHPEHRREGIFSRMNQFAIEYLKRDGYAFFYNFPGPMSRPGYLKQDWKIVAVTETLYRFDNPQKVISYKLKNKFLGTSLGFFYDKLLNTRGKVSALSSSFQIEVFNHFPYELKQVDTLRDKSAIELARGESYLRWRFNGLVYGMIVDYLIKDDDVDCFRGLINKGLSGLEKPECDLVSVWTFNQPLLREELIKHFGFKSSTRFPYNRLLGKGYFVTREINEQLLGKIDIYNKENWQVTSAYSDTT